MRELTDHKVNPANDTIRVVAADDPGSGSAHHTYEIYVPNIGMTRLDFQNGPIAEVGVNGITHEVLLAIVVEGTHQK